jgi:hypothetical protein
LAAKWRIYRRPIRANVDTVELIIKATSCLHNYLLLTDNASYIPTGFVDSESTSGVITPGDWRGIVREDNAGLRNIRRQGSTNYTTNAKEVRDAFCAYVNSPEGSLSWQQDLVRSCG